MIKNPTVRHVFATVAVLLGLLLTPTIMPVPADAVTININVGNSLNSGRRISCAQGERLLRNRGFRDVRRTNCRGQNYVYRGWRSGRHYEITVRSSNGRVVNIRRINR